MTDFWKAYDAFAPRAQKCWAHLLRDVAALADRPSAARSAFAKPVKRIFGDGVRLKLARDELGEEAFDRRVLALHQRLHALADTEWADDDVRRLAKRLTTSERVRNENWRPCPGRRPGGSRGECPSSRNKLQNISRCWRGSPNRQGFP